MMINNLKYSKSFIFLVYNIIMIISIVSCSVTDPPNTEKFVPDYDMIKIEDERDYYKYYFRPSEYAGQLKVLPETFFRSVYNYKYIILPDLFGPYDYNAYEKKFEGGILHSHFESIADEYNRTYNAIKEQEDNYVHLLNKSFEATRNAYDAVKNYEDPLQKNNKNANKRLKDKAIQTYLNNQMPDIPKEIIPKEHLGDKLRYVYENYEVHANPTNEVYYRSNVMQQEFNFTQHMKSYKHLWVQLTNIQYNEVMFLSKFISITMEDESLFTKAKNRTLGILQCTVPIQMHHHLRKYIDESKYEKHGDSDDYRNVTKMMQNKFVVNNENDMSYLVRLKIMGYIGIDTKYHTHLYRERKDFRSSGFKRYYIDMDINTDTKLSEYSELEPFDIDTI